MQAQVALLKANIDADIREINRLYQQLQPHADGLVETEQAITCITCIRPLKISA